MWSKQNNPDQEELNERESNNHDTDLIVYEDLCVKHKKLAFYSEDETQQFTSWCLNDQCLENNNKVGEQNKDQCILIVGKQPVY